MKFGRYLDPFSISIDIRRSQRSRYGSYIAIDSVRLHNCEPGKEKHPSSPSTLRFQTNVWVQINVRGGKFAKNHKLTGPNKHNGWEK